LPPDPSIDYSMVLLGRSDLPGEASPAAVCSVPGILDFTWTDNSGKIKARETGQVFVAACNEEKNVWLYKMNVSDRSVGRCTLEVHLFRGKTVHDYIGFIPADGLEVSDSIYSGMVQLAPT
jgi:Family of unknown function (DUF6266)